MFGSDSNRQLLYHMRVVHVCNMQHTQRLATVSPSSDIHTTIEIEATNFEFAF